MAGALARQQVDDSVKMAGPRIARQTRIRWVSVDASVDCLPTFSPRGGARFQNAVWPRSSGARLWNC